MPAPKVKISKRTGVITVDGDTGQLYAPKGERRNFLTPRQEVFCQEYVKDFNAAKAAQRAGYSASSAYSGTGYQLLRKEKIKNRISEMLKKRFRRLNMDENDVLRAWSMIGSFDIRDLFEEGTGAPIRPDKLSEVASQVVSSVKVKSSEVAGVKRHEIEYKLNDKMAALSNLAKHMGMFGESGEKESSVKSFIEDLKPTTGPPMLDE